MVVGAYSLLINSSKRLEFLPFHNHFSTTPTRRVLCLALHSHPRHLSVQHPQHPRTRLCQENGQAPQMVMLVITRKNTHHRLLTPPVRALQGLTLNIGGMTSAKWVAIQELPLSSSLDYIILTEHQLSAGRDY